MTSFIAFQLQEGRGVATLLLKFTMEISDEDNSKLQGEVQPEEPQLLFAKEESDEDIDFLRLPIWHADDKRDTLTAKQWTAYVQKAKELFHWSDDVTMKCVANALVGQALSWFYKLVRFLPMKYFTTVCTDARLYSRV